MKDTSGYPSDLTIRHLPYAAWTFLSVARATGATGQPPLERGDYIGFQVWGLEPERKQLNRSEQSDSHLRHGQFLFLSSKYLILNPKHDCLM